MSHDYFTFVLIWEVFPIFAESLTAYSLNSLSTSHQTKSVRFSRACLSNQVYVQKNVSKNFLFLIYLSVFYRQEYKTSKQRLA